MGETVCMYVCMWKDRVTCSCQRLSREREKEKRVRPGIFNQRIIVTCYATLTRADTIEALIYVNELTRRGWDNEANLNEFGSWLDQNSLCSSRKTSRAKSILFGIVLIVPRVFALMKMRDADGFGARRRLEGLIVFRFNLNLTSPPRAS